MRRCEDCGERAAYALSSVREESVAPPDAVRAFACDAHRRDVTDVLLNAHGNVTIEEDLG